MISGWYKQLYTKNNKKTKTQMDNLEEMRKLFETHELPRLTQEKAENLTRPFPSTRIESVIKKYPKGE